MKLYFGLLITFLLLLIPYSVGANFTDVSTNHEYYQSVNWLVDNGVISGYADNTFKPEKCVNRAELTKMLFLLDEVIVTSPQLVHRFSDVDQTAWYANYFNHFTNKEAIIGYEDGTARPDQCVTRAEAIKIVGPQIADYGVGAFNDGSFIIPGMLVIDEDNWQWWYGPVLWGFKYGLLPIDHLTTANPISSEAVRNMDYDVHAGMTRIEVAEMLYRAKIYKDNFGRMGLDYRNTEPEPIYSGTGEQPRSLPFTEDCTEFGEQWIRTTFQVLPISFCYNASWGEVSMEEDAITTKTGKGYYIEFADLDLADLIISVTTINRRQTADSGGTPYQGWDNLGHNQLVANIVRTLRDTATVELELEKLIVGDLEAIFTDSVFDNNFYDGLRHANTLYLPYQKIGDKYYNLRFYQSGDNEISNTDMLNVFRSLRY